MNERIRELAAQAGATVDKGTHPLTGVVDGLIMRTTEIEEFAELLVRECARKTKEIVRAISTQGDAEYSEKEIKQHFGVEE